MVKKSQVVTFAAIGSHCGAPSFAALFSFVNSGFTHQQEQSLQRYI